MRFGQSSIVVNGSMSGNIFSPAIDMQQVWVYSMQAFYSGVNASSVAGAGTMKLQVSNDIPSTQLSGSTSWTIQHWDDYTGSLASTSSVAGSSSSMWNVNQPGYRWVRFAYIAASGSGVLSVNYFGKSV